MTKPRPSSEQPALTSPVIDYEPPPVTGAAALCATPSHAALRRHTRRPLRPATSPPVSDTPTPPAAAVFAEAALRRVLEVIDRRRPIGQLRSALVPPLIDTVAALTRSRHTSPARLCRVRLRTAHGERPAAEVFATYTRGGRVRAIAARVELVPTANRWQLVALQIG